MKLEAIAVHKLTTQKGSSALDSFNNQQKCINQNRFKLIYFLSFHAKKVKRTSFFSNITPEIQRKYRVRDFEFFYGRKLKHESYPFLVVSKIFAMKTRNMHRQAASWPMRMLQFKPES